MNLREFTDIALGLQFTLVERRKFENKCLCANGANWEFYRKNLGDRKVVSIWSYNGQVYVAVAAQLQVPPLYFVAYDADLYRWDICNGENGAIRAHADDEVSARYVCDALNACVPIRDFDAATKARECWYRRRKQ